MPPNMKLPVIVMLAALLTGCASKENVYFCRDVTSGTQKHILKPGQMFSAKQWLGPEEYYRIKVTSSVPIAFQLTTGSGDDAVNSVGTELEGTFISPKGKKETVIGMNATALKSRATVNILTERCKPKRMAKAGQECGGLAR